MLALPKMSIDTLIAAAKYIEENDCKSVQAQARQAVPPAPPPPPPPPQPLQPVHIQPAAALPPVMLHKVVQPTVQQQQQQQHFQQVTIQQHTSTNGHIIAPVNAIRIQKKDTNLVSQQPQQPQQQQQQQQRLAVMNSFDLINPAVIDQSSGEVKRKQPPIAFRTGTREVHNKLEKNRRAHLKDCFDDLNAILMNSRDAVKKTSNLNILDSALQCIKDLEKEADANAWEIERLAKEKITHQQRYSALRKDIKTIYNVDVPDIARIDKGRKRHRHADKQKLVEQPVLVKMEPHEMVATTATTTTTAMVAVSVDRTPLTTACTTIPAVIGSVLKLPTSISSNGVSAISNNGITTITDEVIHAAGGTTASIAVATAPQPAYAFGIHQLPVAAANGGLVLQKVLVPKSLTTADGAGHAHHHHHHQLTAQFVSHHAHLPTVVGTTANGGDSKVIVNAQYVVKPLVVVSTASRPS